MISRRSRRRFLGLGASSAFALACSPNNESATIATDAGQGQRRPGKPPQYDSLDFFGLLTLGVNAVAIPIASFRDLARKSDVVATGRIGSIEEGRSIGGPRNTATFATSVARIRVERVALGSLTGEDLFVEFHHSPVVESVDLNRKATRERLLIFGFDTVKYPAKDVHGSGKGIPTGETLYALMTFLGLVVERDGRLAFPLEPHKDLWLSPELSTLDEAVASAVP